jgi:hypothetical protein
MKNKPVNILSVDFDWIKNLNQAEDLLSFLIPLLENRPRKTIFLSYHHQYINKIFNEDIDTEYNLYNIDDHHDYLYENTTNLDVGNWLWYLSKERPKKINYIWISNNNSKHMNYNKTQEAINNLKDYMFDHKISFIKEKNFNKIFLCCSPEYNTAEGITSYKIIERWLKNGT